MKRLIAALVVLLALAWPARALADEVITFEPGEPLNLRIVSGFTATTDAGIVLRFPPGVHVLGEPEWGAIDAEVRRLQDAEVRLTAENESLRVTPIERPRPWWAVVGASVGLIAGIVIGAWAL